MGILTDDMRRMVDEQQLGFIATVCPDGLPDRTKPSRALRIVVKYGRVLDQYQMADLLGGRPGEREIKQQSVVWLLFPFGRVRPVAAPALS